MRISPHTQETRRKIISNNNNNRTNKTRLISNYIKLSAREKRVRVREKYREGKARGIQHKMTLNGIIDDYLMRE